MKNYISQCINHKVTKFLFWGGFVLSNVLLLTLLTLLFIAPYVIEYGRPADSFFAAVEFSIIIAIPFNMISFFFFVLRIIKKKSFSLPLICLFVFNFLILMYCIASVLIS